MNLTFNKGKNADLPSSNLKEGSFYLTTDNHELWFANSSNTKFKISDSNLALKSHKHNWSDINNPPNFALSNHTHTSIGGDAFIIYPEMNEINFGGTRKDSDLYFGYRSHDGRAIPTSYHFGNNDATIYAKALVGNADSATYLKDNANGTASYLAYGSASMSNPTYLAGWDGYTIRAVNRSDLSVNYANSAGSASSASTATTATYIKDSNNGSNMTIRYGGNGVGVQSWFPAYVGESLQPISADNLKRSLFKDNAYNTIYGGIDLSLGSNNLETDAGIRVTQSNNNDWGIIINKTSADYGISIRCNNSHYALQIQGGININQYGTSLPSGVEGKLYFLLI